jgi:DNA-binding SARP family transcriptional activator/DNA-binding beta-propeller fold protein YncE
MEFRLLGPLEVVGEDGPADVGAGKRRALLTYLLINANEVVPTERLIDELWGEMPPATAAKSVQVYVSQLRKALHANGDVLVTRGSGYALQLGDDDLDVQRFERLLAEAQRTLDDGDAKAAGATARAALALWRGPALYDVAYESFAQTEAARLDELRLVALETRIDADLVLGEHARLVGELEGLVAEHPLRERFRAQLMVALYRCGRQSEALDTYRDGSRNLMDELGLEPSAELRELEQKILTQDPDLAGPRLWRPAARRQAAQVVRSERRARRGATVVVGGALLLGIAAMLALLERNGTGTPKRTGVTLDAANSAVAVDLGARTATAAIPLPGRSTDAVGDGRTVWVTTVDSAGVTAIDTKSQKIAGTVPLAGRPDGVARAGGSLWVVDGTRGELVAIKPGYDRVYRRIRFAPAKPDAALAGRLRAPRSTVVAAGGGLWVSNGSRALTRVNPGTGTPRVTRLERAINALAGGSGALWGLSSKTATVVRIDPRTGTATDRIPIVARQGPEAAAPTGIAAAGRWVWVLNGNTATVTRIEAATGGVVATVPIGVDRIPTDIAATRRMAWIANRDGTLAQVGTQAQAARTIWIGGSPERVATVPRGVWVTTAALDQQLAGGSG